MGLSRIIRIPRALRNLQRFRRIMTVVMSHGFGDVAMRAGLDRMLNTGLRVLTFRKPAAEQLQAGTAQYTTEQRIRMICEELGPTFIKLGQIMATRPDLIPMSLVHELRRLQDDVPPFPFEDVRRQVETQLGRPLEQAYLEFDPLPLGAASIGQVHRARLPTGERVVVKVRRPHLEEIVETDIDILLFIAGVAQDNLSEAKNLDLVGTVEQFARSIREEIDYTREAHNMVRFMELFGEMEGIKVPRVYPSHSGKQVLTQEFIEGIKASRMDELRASGLDLGRAAQAGTRCVLRQIFEFGFFHADPHPGNLFVLADGRLAFIDFGQMGLLDEKAIDDLLVFLVAILFNDTKRLIRLLQKLGLLDEFADAAPLTLEINEILRRYYGQSVEKVDIARFITDVFEVIAKHDVRIPSHLFLMGKSIATMEGVVQDLYPQYNPIASIRAPLLEIYIKKLSDPRFLARDALATLDEYLLLVDQLPRDLRLLLSRLRNGKLEIVNRIPELEGVVREVSRGLNRAAIALVAGGLMLGSAMLVAFAKQTPSLGGVDFGFYLGLSGLGAGALVGFWVLVGSTRSP